LSLIAVGDADRGVPEKSDIFQEGCIGQEYLPATREKGRALDHDRGLLLHEEAIFFIESMGWRKSI